MNNIFIQRCISNIRNIFGPYRLYLGPLDGIRWRNNRYFVAKKSVAFIPSQEEWVKVRRKFYETSKAEFWRYYNWCETHWFSFRSPALPRPLHRKHNKKYSHGKITKK